MPTLVFHHRFSLFCLTFAAACCASPRPAFAIDGDAEWIWSPAQPRNEIPEGDCYFRKSFRAANVEEAQIQITADNQFELFLNGQRVAQGADWRQLVIQDVAKLIKSGTNVLAVKATNTDQGAAGLVVRVLIKERSGTYVAFSTDSTWKTSVRPSPNWTLPQFSDRDWVDAVAYGPLGDALPWGNEIVVAGEGARFTLGENFVVERLMRDSEVGSLIAMTFDARGNLFASQEGGGVLLLSDSDENGIHDTVTPFCDTIQNAQGLLALGSRLFAVGDGPDGPALYRLRDADRDGRADEVTKLVGIRGSKGEHGAHAVRLGPDGLLYVVIGDHARVDAEPVSRSPYRGWYEGDLVTPKYEDPHGHANGIPAPGGTLFRTDAEGSFVELVAGGMRNAYDFAFDADGEMFAYDADMEWDRGAPWYRPTRINHVTAGAEMGWRSGWSKWPASYLDSLPSAIDIGPGSPTGVEFYDHYVFPKRYRGALFACDWATGHIHAVTFQREGATYRGTKEVFLSGRPLNATDVVVGPDGALYFCTGGRGTDGGVYRIRCTSDEGAETSTSLRGVESALHQPQINADWARARIAQVRRTLGDSWGPSLNQVASDKRRSVDLRLRAVDLLVYFGPRPDAALLRELASDTDPLVRAKAARLMFNDDLPEIRTALVKLLADDDPLVRRVACESLVRRGALPPADAVLPLLGDDDRFVVFAARRLLEQLPVDDWARDVLESDDAKTFLHGAAALVNRERLPATSKAVLNQCAERWPRAVDATAADWELRRDLLRVTQLALVHGKLTGADVPELAPALLATYPTSDAETNRELVRLLTYLQAEGAAPKMAAQVEADIPWEDKLHAAGYAARLDVGWNTPSKLAILRFFEAARTREGGYSVDAYVELFARDFLRKMSLAEQRHLLASGEKWPATALSVLASLPDEPLADLLAEIRDLDQRIKPLLGQHDAYRRLRVGVVAVLGRTSDVASQRYLHDVFRSEPDYRDPVAMSLSQHPTGDNWAILVESLRTAEGTAAREILTALARAPKRPAEATPFRDAILQGLRLRQNGALLASQLLSHWSEDATEPHFPISDKPWTQQMAHWQKWYAKQFPDAPPARLPVDVATQKWSYAELLTYLESPSGKGGDPVRGAETFAKAQCIGCHRCGTRGETMGPDLTSVGKRFQRKEILESIVYPSHIISDQYASRVISSGGKTFSGLVARNGSIGLTILQSNGQKSEISLADVENISLSSTSIMPEGLLDPLSLQQVADLFAYLTQTKEPEVARR